MDRMTELQNTIRNCRTEMNEILDRENREYVKNCTNRYFKQKIDGNDYHYDGNEYQDCYEYRKYLGPGKDDFNYSCFLFKDMKNDGSYTIETSHSNNNDPRFFEEISAEEFYSAWHKLLKDLGEVS
jgi:hypothetical protein